MKSYAVIPLTLSVFFTQNAFAACDNPVSNATAELSNTTVCVGSSPNWEHQEEHYSNGDLWDYKKGPSDPIDPSEDLGSWEATGSVVTYNYGSAPYIFTLHKSGSSTYEFCNGTAPIVSGATLTGIGSGC